MNKRAKIIKFVNSNKKQIIFALFALIYLFFDNNSEVYKSVAPVVVAEGVKAAKVGVDAMKAAKTAKAAGDTAKMVKEGAKAASNINTAVQTAKTAKDEIKNSNSSGQKVKNTAMTAGGIALGAKDSGLSMKIPRHTNNIPKTTNSITPESQQSNISNTPKNLSFAPIPKENNSNAETDDTVEGILNEDDTNVVKKNNPVTIFIITIVIILLFTITVPLLLITGGVPTTNIMKGINCQISSDKDCKVEDNATFLEKLKNLLKYGSFASNNQVLINKVEDIYNRIYNKYEVKINIPLLISSLMADLTTEELTKSSSNNGISDEILKRVKYADELAMMQFKISDQNYKCKEKDEEEDDSPNYSDGKYFALEVSDLELILQGIDPNSVEFHICDEKYVDEYMKIIDVVYDEGRYLDILKDSLVLKAIYPEYDNDRDAIIKKIEQQNDLYELLYGTGEKDQGTIPGSLLNDEKVNLKSPLKGKITITSPFGNREGVFSGYHKGIDVVSNDKTIYAAGNGVVTRANFEMLGGNVVEITHTDSNGNRYVSQYGHLNQILVSVGTTVKTGDVIGIMGSTGVVTGPHLHYQMWRVSPYELFNPRNLFAEATNY